MARESISTIPLDDRTTPAQRAAQVAKAIAVLEDGMRRDPADAAMFEAKRRDLLLRSNANAEAAA